MLDMLERMIDGLESESDAHGDVGLMRDIMTYMIRFPDHTHHPMEDLMFERMRARGLAPQTEHTIGKLPRERGSLARKGEALHLASLRFEDGARSERPALVAMGRDYVEFLRFHARLEERTVFVEAESLLGDTDWTEIEQAFEERTDSVFGPRVDSDFRALYQPIKKPESGLMVLKWLADHGIPRRSIHTSGHALWRISNTLLPPSHLGCSSPSTPSRPDGSAISSTMLSNTTTANGGKFESRRSC